MGAAAIARPRKRTFWAGALGAFAAALALAAAPAASAQTVIRDAEIEQVLRDYSNPLFAAAELNPKDIDITIIQDPSLNAFVTDGQRMFLHTGLIMASKTPGELKGVIAHETGHISGGHLVRMASAAQASMAPALISIGLGILAIAAGAPDAGAALISGSSQFAMANFVRHTKVQESAADQAAVTFLDATGQSARGLLSFFENFRYMEVMSDKGRNPYFRTHPLSSDRIEALRVRVEAAEHRNAPENPADMKKLSMIQAKLFGFLESPTRVFSRYPDRDTSPEARYARAIAACGCGVTGRTPDVQRARTELAALIAAEPNNPYFHELMGQVLFENGRAEESLTHYRRALELLPENALFLVNLARAETSAGGKPAAPAAIALLQKAVAREPDNAFAWKELATSYDLNGEGGLARLASAEQYFAIGDMPTARNFAERARRNLTEGTPSWRQASDIINATETQLRRPRRS